MRHGNMERHTVTRRDPGMETCLFSSLLVVSSGLVIRPSRCGLNYSVSEPQRSHVSLISKRYPILNPIADHPNLTQI